MSNSQGSNCQKVKQITNWKEIAPMKFFIKAKSQDQNVQWNQINKCSICLCELFEDIKDDEEEKNEEIRNSKLISRLMSSQNDLLKNLQQLNLNELNDSYQIVILPKCKGIHLFHKECLAQQQLNSNGEFLKCGICETVYGIRIGEMPDGTMNWYVIKQQIPGFYDCSQAYVIEYKFNDGFLNNKKYTGTRRQAFLPKNKEGHLVLGMLILAFIRRLTFLVGTSLTTGSKDTVVWAGIHHKTSLSGGAFGFPDQTYIKRVLEELQLRNIDEESIQNLQVQNCGQIEIENQVYKEYKAQGIQYKKS